MNRILKFLLSTLFAVALLVAAAAGALAWWLSGDGPRMRVQALASERLGVPVTLGKLSLSVLPWPALVVDDLTVATQPPVTAQQVQLRPAWGKLLSAPRELEVSLLSLKGLNLPQQGLDQVTQSLSKSERSTQNIQGVAAQKASKNVWAVMPDSPAVLVGLLAIPQHTQLQGVVWYSKAGQALALSGDVRMSATRDEAQVDLKLGGGTVRGPLRLAQKTLEGKAPDVTARWKLHGEMKTQGVELAALPGMGARLAGRLEATTTLDAQAAQIDGISAALQTRTQFSVGGGVIKGVDLVRAVTTLGLSRGGETALQQLSGVLTTRGTGAPMQLSLTGLQAKSKLLSASGAVNVGAAASPGAPRGLSGRVSVDLTAGDSVVSGAGTAIGALVGIPLEIGGTTANPQVQPTKGAMIGGAIGSVMAPVIGTGAGAKLGDKAATTLSNLKDKLFGK